MDNNKNTTIELATTIKDRDIFSSIKKDSTLRIKKESSKTFEETIYSTVKHLFYGFDSTKSLSIEIKYNDNLLIISDFKNHGHFYVSYFVKNKRDYHKHVTYIKGLKNMLNYISLNFSTFLDKNDNLLNKQELKSLVRNEKIIVTLKDNTTIKMTVKYNDRTMIDCFNNSGRMYIYIPLMTCDTLSSSKDIKNIKRDF